MAYRRRSSRRTYRRRRPIYRRRFRTRRGRRPTGKKTVRNTSFTPQRTQVKVSYDTWFTFNEATVAWQYFTFRGNEAYDPDYAVGGQAPAGWGRYQGYYQNYLCWGSKVEATFFQSDNQTPPMLCSVHADKSTSQSQPIWPTYSANPFTTTRVLTSANGGRPTRIKKYVPTTGLFGITKTALNSEMDYAGNAQSVGSVNRPWYWHIGVQNPNAGTIGLEAFPQVKLRITYYVTFFNRNEVSA